MADDDEINLDEGGAGSAPEKKRGIGGLLSGLLKWIIIGLAAIIVIVVVVVVTVVFFILVEPNVSYHGVSFYDALGPAAFVTYIRAILLRDTGASISPVNAFIALQGLETLSLRVERHSYNAAKVVEYLAKNPKVERHVYNALKVVKYLESNPHVEKVHHPSVSKDKKQQELYKKYYPNGGGSIFTFEIKGTEEDTLKFIDNLKLFSLLANVADVKSLVIHPASTTHSEMTEEELKSVGIYKNTVRLSIGTEHIDDIIADGGEETSKLKAARAAKDLSQEQLAALCKVSRQTINAIEKGDYNPTINLCISICKALDKTLNDLFWEEEI